MTRHLWRELERLADTRPLGGRVERTLAGTMGGGYLSVWASTDPDLLALTEQDGASRAVPHSAISGVVRPGAASVGVLTGGPEALTLRSDDDVAGFASALAARTSVPPPGAGGLFSEAGFAPFTGAVTEITGEYLGGLEGLRPSLVRVVFDADGILVATAARPWWRVAQVPWPDVRDLVVEGSEETRRRVSIARVAALGPLGLALPDEADSSRAYLTVVTDAGDVLRRPAGSAPANGNLVDQIARLGELHASGILTAEEFAAAKRKLLGL